MAASRSGRRDALARAACALGEVVIACFSRGDLGTRITSLEVLPADYDTDHQLTVRATTCRQPSAPVKLPAYSTSWPGR